MTHHVIWFISRNDYRMIEISRYYNLIAWPDYLEALFARCIDTTLGFQYYHREDKDFNELKGKLDASHISFLTSNPDYRGLIIPDTDVFHILAYPGIVIDPDTMTLYTIDLNRSVELLKQANEKFKSYFPELTSTTDETLP